MSRLVITQTNELRQGFRKKTLRTQFRLGHVSLIFALVTLIAILSILQLLHANRIATRGYVIRNLEAEKAKLVNDNKVLQMQVARAKSLSAIVKQEAGSRMVAATSPTFLFVDNTLAHP